MVTIINSVTHLKSGETNIDYSRSGDQDVKTSEKPPRPEFHKALEALLVHALLCFGWIKLVNVSETQMVIKKDQKIRVPVLPASFVESDAADFRVNGVHLTRKKKSTAVKIGFTYDGPYGSSSPLTPLQNISFQSEGGYPFTDHLAYCIEEVLKEAELFLDGNYDPDYKPKEEEPEKMPELGFDASNARDRESSTKIQVLKPEEKEETWEDIQNRTAGTGGASKKRRQTQDNPGGDAK